MSAVAQIAWRHLTARPRQTLLTVAGVALGVAVFIFTVSMMDGLVVFFTQRLIRVSPLLTVQPERLDGESAREVVMRGEDGDVVLLSRQPPPDERPTVRGAVPLAGRIRRLAGVEGASVALTAPVVLAFGTYTEPATLVGVEVAAEEEVTSLPGLVEPGRWGMLAERRDGAVLGVQLADRLGVEVGDRLVALGEVGRRRELEVVGIIRSGLGSVDEATLFVNLAVAQSIGGRGGDEGSEIRVRSTALGDLEGIRDRLQRVTGYRVKTWQETSAPSLKLFRTIGVTTYLLTGFVLVVAGLGIANKLTTVILDKERDIAVLRSFGFSRPAVRGVFVLEGVALAGAGAALGCGLAAFAIAYFTAFPIRFAPREGAVMAYTELFLANRVAYYVIVSAAALVIATLASLLAVRRVSHVVPVEVLRGTA